MNTAHSGDDSDLIGRCILKDGLAWSALLEKYSSLIKSAIYVRAKKYGTTLSPHDIEDIMQDVLAAIWKDGKLSTIINRKDISYWLAIVSGNAAAQYLRDKDDAKSLEDENAILAETARDEETLPEIEKAIEKLPPKERLIIELHLFHDKKYREIADILDLPEGTVSSYIKRSKERLKKSLRFLQPFT